MKHRTALAVSLFLLSACGGRSSPVVPTAATTVPNTATKIVVETVRITAPAVISAGRRVQLSAVATMSDQTLQGLNPTSVTWQSSDTAVATVSTQGSLLALQPGMVNVRGTFQLQTSEPLSVNVKAPLPPPRDDVSVGETIEAELTSHGSSLTFRVTPSSNGTLVVQVSYDRTQAILELDFDGKYVAADEPILVKLPVIAGREYRITVGDGAPWDYDDLYVRFALTTSMQ